MISRVPATPVEHAGAAGPTRGRTAGRHIRPGPQGLPEPVPTGPGPTVTLVMTEPQAGGFLDGTNLPAWHWPQGQRLVTGRMISANATVPKLRVTILA
jgi:hypothetical protein